MDYLKFEYGEEDLGIQALVIAPIPGYKAARDLVSDNVAQQYFVFEGLPENVDEESVTVEELIGMTLPEVSAELLGESYDDRRYDDEAVHLPVEDVDNVLRDLDLNVDTPLHGPQGGSYTWVNEFFISEPYQRGKEEAQGIESVEDLEEISEGNFRNPDFQDECREKLLLTLVGGSGATSAASLATQSPEIFAGGTTLTVLGTGINFLGSNLYGANSEYEAGKKFQLSREGSKMINEEIEDEIGDLNVQVNEW